MRNILIALYLLFMFIAAACVAGFVLLPGDYPRHCLVGFVLSALVAGGFYGKLQGQRL